MGVKFTATEAEQAHEMWGCNCGPGAIAAVLGLSLAELRPRLGDFETRRYMNPTLMWETLDRLGASWRSRKNPRAGRNDKLCPGWPVYGLARIQWEGPWTQPGVPAAAAYRHTHWVGANTRNPANVGIFDINCMNAGGWVPVKEWTEMLVPWLLENTVPRANGKWHLTHVVEIEMQP